MTAYFSMTWEDEIYRNVCRNEQILFFSTDRGVFCFNIHPSNLPKRRRRIYEAAPPDALTEHHVFGESLAATEDKLYVGCPSTSFDHPGFVAVYEIINSMCPELIEVLYPIRPERHFGKVIRKKNETIIIYGERQRLHIDGTTFSLDMKRKEIPAVMKTPCRTLNVAEMELTVEDTHPGFIFHFRNLCLRDNFFYDKQKKRELGMIP